MSDVKYCPWCGSEVEKTILMNVDCGYAIHANVCRYCDQYFWITPLTEDGRPILEE